MYHACKRCKLVFLLRVWLCESLCLCCAVLCDRRRKEEEEQRKRAQQDEQEVRVGESCVGSAGCGVLISGR